MNRSSLETTPLYTYENRLMGKFHGAKSSPTVVVIAGIHGNERAGVHAAKNVLEKIKSDKIVFDGNLFFILGNINALNKRIRFEKIDLNRIWRNKNMEDLFNSEEDPIQEVKEQLDIYELIKEILENENGPFYFLDLRHRCARYFRDRIRHRPNRMFRRCGSSICPPAHRAEAAAHQSAVIFPRRFHR